MLRLLWLSILATTLCILLAAPVSAQNHCGFKINYTPNKVHIQTTQGMQFKIEREWIKTLIPSAFGTHEWGLAAYNKYQAEIIGMFKTDKGYVKANHLYARLNRDNIEWYLIADSNIYDTHSDWMILSHINGQITCERVQRDIALEMADILSTPSESKSIPTVTTVNPLTIYNQLGLNATH